MTLRLKNSFANVLTVLFCLPMYCQTTDYEFHDGCCLNRQTFQRPKEVSKETVPTETLLRTLNCATSSRLVGDLNGLADRLGTGSELLVAYYYGTYMPEQDEPTLTLGVYSRDGNQGMLIDASANKDEYAVANIPLLKRDHKTWRVGEVNGGLWTYTRLYYLAQEIGTRHRQPVPLKAIGQSHAAKCWVMNERIR